MLARLCNQSFHMGEEKRRQSWSSGSFLPGRRRSDEESAWWSDAADIDSDDEDDDELEDSPAAFALGASPHPDLLSPCRCLDNDEQHYAVIAEPEPSVTSSDNYEPEGESGGAMGQKLSSSPTPGVSVKPRPRLSLTWVLRSHQHKHKTIKDAIIQAKEAEEAEAGSAFERPTRTASEPCLVAESTSTSASTPNAISTTVGERSSRTSHRHHRKHRRRHRHRVGYEIHDVDAFLANASLDQPANIPVVLSAPCMLYQTSVGGCQQELSLPLGMVVNAVFKNQVWVYVQTPHGEEGYVRYASCLPLGILPPPPPPPPPPHRNSSKHHRTPCWESHADIFPHPRGNRTDLQKSRDGTRSECGRPRRAKHLERDAVSACGERSVDRLYLRAAASAKIQQHQQETTSQPPSASPPNANSSSIRHTLLVIRSDYHSKGRNTLSVVKGDVVQLMSSRLKDWFWVRASDGREGFIPSVVAGHGFL